jgi:transposase-like protein
MMTQKRGKYVYHDLEFKTKLVKLYLNGADGFRTIAKEYGLKDARQLRDWVKKYQNGELTDDKSDQRGKYSFNKKIFKNAEEEPEYVKLENDYLKKNCFRRASRRASLQIYGRQRI